MTRTNATAKVLSKNIFIVSSLNVILRVLRGELSLPGYSRARNAGAPARAGCQSESSSRKRAACDSSGFTPAHAARACGCFSIIFTSFLGHRVPCQMADVRWGALRVRGPSCKRPPLGGRRDLRHNATRGSGRRSSESEWLATPAVGFAGSQSRAGIRERCCGMRSNSGIHQTDHVSGSGERQHSHSRPAMRAKSFVRRWRGYASDWISS